MLDITRIERIGMAVPALEPQVAILEGLFGFRAGEPERDADGGVERVRLSVPGDSDIDWEVATPSGEQSYLHSFVTGPAGPGLHHVLFRVPDLLQAVDALRALAIEPWSEQWESPDVPLEECFIHPRRGGQGFLFRLRGPEPDGERPPPASGGDGSLGIIAINHLSHAHANRDELAHWYTRVFGMRSFHRSAEDLEQQFVTDVMETPTGQMRWEVLQPRGERSFVQRFLERRGPGIHHVTFEVADWDRAIEACRAHGVEPFGRRDGVTDGARWSEAFIHPREAGGMLVQFFWQERPRIWV